ncbi:MAG TPA: hypothetical protein DCZ94_03925 [Lentisphaeria bacterium]|nr:MAG: hypothetical protein A2X48_05145 [Lentisphaerae bacterium GWF2_49_21]HBC86083.1 hypothetical protein [Lentisphaeria bacterium]
MPIHFNEGRWKKVSENYGRWWDGKLDRPLIHLTVTGNDPGRKPSKHPCKGFAAAYDKSVTAEEIADAWDYNLSTQRFLGDAFPSMWLNFGPGALAAFLGSKLEHDERTVWFHPEKVEEIKDINFHWDYENYWLNRVKSIAEAADRRFQGSAQIGMTDLGGVMDVLSTFRPSEKLLMDLYDSPDEVKRLSWQIFDLWWRAYDEIDSVQRHNPGYTCWTPIFSDKPYYMTQSDFCYMIGPDMFDEFVKPELAATHRRLTNGFYHLDGPGELAHLDSLLKIKELKGIQWIPGDGQPPPEEWPDVYRKIRDAGKLIQVFGNKSGFKTLDKMAEDLGSAKGIVFIHSVDASKLDEAKAFMKRHGCDEE